MIMNFSQSITIDNFLLFFVVSTSLIECVKFNFVILFLFYLPTFFDFFLSPIQEYNHELASISKKDKKNINNEYNNGNSDNNNVIISNYQSDYYSNTNTNDDNNKIIDQSCNNGNISNNNNNTTAKRINT